jgi:AraC-like DNA-binding protein
MSRKISEEIKIDPSDIHQYFQDVTVRLLCCRYWILEEWECNDLKVPFWRLYHNSTSGSVIRFDNKNIDLDEKSIIIIPPNTSFSSKLKQNIYTPDESIKGRKFGVSDDIDELKSSGKVDHLFIHFSLGYPLDFVQSGIMKYIFNETTRSLLQKVKESCINETITNYSECLRTKQLISDCLLQLPNSIWESGNIDHRILKSIKYIEANYQARITNEQLAATANMATNSFARLFKQSTGMPTQQYILKLKIQAACNLIHHTNKSFDQISFDCGFSDRHHFSKVFKKILKINPSNYKKKLMFDLID